MNKNISFRTAAAQDAPLVLSFIRQLADYENMTGQVVADEKELAKWIFEKNMAQVLFVCEGEEAVGFALYFYNFSTFLGKPGLYIEDLFVRPAYRKKGYGKALMLKLARLAKADGCGRVEWACLNWNEPSIRFYTSLGAHPMNEWKVYRLDGEALESLTT
jgi:GNAT superfamily N-acetyltransferase